MTRKQEADKDKLQVAIAGAMKTIMIGAVASVEEKLGMLWAQGQERNLTPNEQKFYDIFMDLRKSILDKGNTQIRNCKQLIDGYTVEYTGFTISFPIVRNG